MVSFFLLRILTELPLLFSVTVFNNSLRCLIESMAECLLDYKVTPLNGFEPAKKLSVSN